MRILIKNGDVEIANGNPVILSELSKVQLLSARHSFGELPAHASPPFDGASVVVVVTATPPLLELQLLSELSKLQLPSARHSAGVLPAHAPPSFDGASVEVVVAAPLLLQVWSAFIYIYIYTYIHKRESERARERERERDDEGLFG